LNSIESVSSQEYDNWSKLRLSHLLVDYLSRNGFNETANLLSKDPNIYDLVDTNIIESTQKIQKSLKKRSCQEALKWCSENKSVLKKHKVK
jgi:macrophage erythroblast attacher